MLWSCKLWGWVAAVAAVISVTAGVASVALVLILIAALLLDLEAGYRGPKRSA